MLVKGSCDVDTAVAWARESKMQFIEQQRRRRQETAQPLCLPQTGGAAANDQSCPGRGLATAAAASAANLRGVAAVAAG